MHTLSLYDILENVMEDYTYTLKKKGNKLEVTGTVYIELLNEEVTLKEEFCVNSAKSGITEAYIRDFKTAFRKKVLDKLQENKEVLLDHNALFKKLYNQIVELREELEAVKEENRRLHGSSLTCPDITPVSPYVAPQSPGTTPWNPWPSPIWCSTDSNSKINDEPIDVWS